MKKIFKIFLIFLYAIFTLGIGNCQAYTETRINETFETQIKQEQNSDSSVFEAVSTNDTAIASANNNGYEISALKSDRENNFCNFENETINNNFIKQKYKTYLNEILNNKFSNISPNIAYEICTRAP